MNADLLIADRRIRSFVLAAIAAAIAVALVLPILDLSNFWLHLLDMMLINAVLALGLNVVLKTGQVSLAHAAFIAIGAYTSAQLSVMFGLPFLLSFVAAGFGAALTALVLGRVILRLKGVYFMLFRFALTEFVFLLAKDLTAVTGGNTGIIGIKPPALPFIGTLHTKAAFYYFALAVFLLSLGALAALYRSPLGRAMNAIRESELLAASTGYNPMRVKIIAFTIGSLLAGLGGSLLAHFLRYIAPFNFTFWDSVNVLLMNIVGGSFSLAGPVIGAIVLTILPELLRDYGPWQQALYGLILMLFMRFLPDGVVSVITPYLRTLAESVIRWPRAGGKGETAVRPAEPER